MAGRVTGDCGANLIEDSCYLNDARFAPVPRGKCCATMLGRMNASLSSSSRFQAVGHGGEAAKPPILPRSARQSSAEPVHSPVGSDPNICSKSDISNIWIHLTLSLPAGNQFRGGAKRIKRVATG